MVSGEYVGIKCKRVGIQGEVQMDKLENLHGKKQTSLIPFQIQDLEERGEDKRSPYLMYLLRKRET
jgi:single-stranded DNA-binding protein